MIKAILLDVGGTLIKVTPSVGHVYSRVARQHGLVLNPSVLNKRFLAAWLHHKRSRFSYTKKWWKVLVADVFKPFLKKPSDRLFTDLYNSFLNASAWRVFPDVVPFLEKAFQLKVPIYVASNWDYRLPAILETLNLKKYFTRLYISYRMRRSKPDPRFFKMILNDLALLPNEVIHIGDELENDVLAPMSLGIRAFQVRSNGRTLNSVLKSLDINFRN